MKRILDLDERMLGITGTEMRKYAYYAAEELGLRHNFSNKHSIAGKDWFEGFLGRNDILALRRGEATSNARMKGFNEETVQQFFDVLAKALERHNYSAGDIYNMDETEIAICAKSNSTKILSRKGKKRIGQKSSAERGKNVTGVICMAANGQYMPPCLIFPRKKRNKKFPHRCTTRSLGRVLRKWIHH